MRSVKHLGFILVVGILSALQAKASSLCGAQDRPPLFITDNLGRRVEIPGRASRIISLEPEITRIIVALGAGDRLVGLDFFLRNQDHLFPIVFPASQKLPVVSNQGQDLNFELALHLRPDILFSSPSEEKSTETIQQKLRVPVVALASIGRLENLLNEIDLMGRILGREDRARELLEYFRTGIATVRQTVGNIPEASRPRVFLSFWGSLLRTPVVYDPVEAAGGVNRAAGLIPSYLGTAAATVGVEQIIRWDPDIILVQGNYPPGERLVTVESVIGDPRLASLKAVRSRRVHYAFGFWYWWDPALVLLETQYLARIFYPDLFPAFDLEKEGNDVFKRFYGVEGGFTALDKVLNCHEWRRE
ncbi:MAG: ABC transporter substrate-binding protein [Candidatus Aminicenantales bacterium]|jgi:iron complex transport system substrate-binding protein